MLLLIYILLILIGLFIRVGKWYRFAVVVSLFVLVSTNIYRADYNIHLNLYNSSIEGIYYFSVGANYGWVLLCRLGHFINLTFDGFAIICIVISMVLIILTITRYTKTTGLSNKVLAAFMVFPALIDLIQLRHFVAISIVIFAIRFIVDRKRFGVLYYCIAVFIATTIHSAVVIYLMFVLVLLLSDKVRKVLPVFMTVFAVLIIILTNFTTVITDISSLIIGDLRTTVYILNPITASRFETIIACFALYICNFLLLKYATKNLNRSIIEESDVEPTSVLIKSFAADVRDCNILLFSTLPFIFFTNDFARFPRSMTVLNCIVFASDIYYERNKDKKFRKILIYSTYILLLFVGFIFMYNYDDIVVPLFTYDKFRPIIN